MSQSIRIGSSLGPILQHTPNTSSSSSSSSSSCMFLSTEHTTTEVGFPRINLSMKEFRKRAALISNPNPRLPFLLCTAKLKSNVDLDEDEDEDLDGTSKAKGKYVPLWRRIVSNFRWVFYPKEINKGVVVMMIIRDTHHPIDALKVLLDVSGAWRRILAINYAELYDTKRFEDYGESYLRKARMEGGTNKGKHNMLKNPPSRITTRLSILWLLADLNDPNDGLKVLLGALEVWRMLFNSKELNDSEGYLQKEISEIRDLSQRSRILVSNRRLPKISDIHDAENPPLQITYVLELLKLMIDNFKDPSEAGETMLEVFRYYDRTCGSLVSLVAKLNFDDNDGYL